MRLTLVRHGATAWNATRRFQGQTDIELSDEGRAQARALARVLAPEAIDRMYSSDLARARETAALIAPRGIAVRTDARLREFDFGAWEGLTWAQILAKHPHLGEQTWRDPNSYEPEGGETFAAVRERVGEFLREIAGSGAHVVVVTHAGPLHAAMHELGLDGQAALFSPASLTRIAMESDRSRIITMNDVQHLYPAG